MGHPTYAEIDLDIFENNFNNIKSSLKDGAGIMVLAKANAYGHGLKRISQKAQEIGARYIGVATVEEGVQVRQAGITIPVLALDAIPRESIEAALQHDVCMTVFSLKNLDCIIDAAQKTGVTPDVHIQMDTGMARAGVYTLDELERVLRRIKITGGVKLAGLYTHFAESDAFDKSFSLQQHEQFQQAARIARSFGFDPMLHASNSGGVTDLQQSCFDMVRPGILMYGYYPSAHVKRDISVNPVMSIHTQIVQLKMVEAGVSVSYDRTYFTDKKTVVATIPVGYGDGYKRLFSNTAKAVVCGRLVPVIGRVCMDLTMLDVTGVEGVEEGSDVVLLGRQVDASVTADDLAEWAQTISYEVLLSFSERVPRLYKERGEYV